MDDTISRQQAIDAVLNDKVEITEKIKAIGSTELFKTLNMTCDRHAKMLRELPSAEPQERKTGRWIMHIDDLFPVESTMECSECHEHQYLICDDNFCPNCGARMEVG